MGDVGARGNADQGLTDAFGGDGTAQVRGGRRTRTPAEAARPGKVRRPAGYIALTISSTIFFASANSIMVLSRKNSSFSMPA